MNYIKIVSAGSGVLGYQIAFQIAFHGFEVVVYDINDEILEKAKEKFHILSKAYEQDLGATPEQIKATQNNLSYCSDLAIAVKDADLVIESIPENIEIKKSFYTGLGKLAPEKTVFATNTSSLVPSQFAEYTGRPEKFLALHFANNIWKRNTAEIMGHSTTDPKVFDEVVEFAKAIGMLALPLHKEQPGYIINSLLIPFFDSATDLIVKGVAEAKTIDKTWMKGTGAPLGPCAMLDIVGLTTAHNVQKLKAAKTGLPFDQKVVDYFQENYISKNKLGISTGEGFYTYPNPEYTNPDFLKE